MAIGSGLGAQFGFSVNEAAYGTYTAPTKFVRPKSAMVEPVLGRQQGTGISSGDYGPLGALYAQTTTAAAGSLAIDIGNRGLGVLYNTLMGGSVTPTTSSTWSSYTAAFPLADTYGKYITIQTGVPVRAGTTPPTSSASGCKVTSAEFSCAVDGFLEGVFEFDGKSYFSTQSLASYSSPASTALFNGSQMTLKMGTYNSETSVSGVRSVSARISRPHDTSDFTAGQSGAKSEPVLNGLTEISVSIEADWLAKTTFQDLAHGTTATSLVWEFTGGTHSGTYVDTWRLTLPSVYFEPGTQGINGPQELTNTWNAVWRYDGSNLPKITTISADSAL